MANRHIWVYRSSYKRVRFDYITPNTTFVRGTTLYDELEAVVPTSELTGSNIEQGRDSLNRIIAGIIRLVVAPDFNKDIQLYKSEEDIDIYINNEKIINETKYKFEKKGKYKFKLLFKNKITNLKGLFGKCLNLYSLNMFNLDTSNVTDMEDMFNNCKKLKEIKGLNKFNTNKVTNMSPMFQQCNELISLDLSNFNTSNVTDMSFMFFHCYKLEYLNINNFILKNNCEAINIFLGLKNECIFCANDKILNHLYSSLYH